MAGLTSSSLERLLNDDNFADFTISCANKDFKIHRAIICADSPFFRAVCDLEFKEKEESRLTLPEDRADIITRVLLFLYTGDYNDQQDPAFGIDRPMVSMSSPSSVDAAAEAENGIVPQISQNIANDAEMTVSTEVDPANQVNDEGSDCATVNNEQEKLLSALDTNARVYICADKFGLEILKACATKKFMARLKMAEEESIIDCAYRQIQLVDETTDSTDAHLRRAVTRHCINNDGFTISPKVRILVEKHKPTTWEISMELRDKSRDKVRDLHQRLSGMKLERDTAQKALRKSSRA